MWAAFTKLVLKRGKDPDTATCSHHDHTDATMATHDQDVLNQTLDGIDNPSDQEDRLEELRSVERRYLKLRDDYAGKEIPQAILNDVFMDFMFCTTRTSRTLLKEITISPDDCRRIHDVFVTKGELQPLLDKLEHLQSKASKKSLMEHFSFAITALFVICCTVWAIYTINSIPPEHRGAAFETMVNAVKELND